MLEAGGLQFVRVRTRTGSEVAALTGYSSTTPPRSHLICLIWLVLTWWQVGTSPRQGINIVSQEIQPNLEHY